MVCYSVCALKPFVLHYLRQAVLGAAAADSCSSSLNLVVMTVLARLLVGAVTCWSWLLHGAEMKLAQHGGCLSVLLTAC